MHFINPDIDIVAQVIKAVLAAKPDDAFCKSILQQYIERGGLSKKQLEGLHSKALKIPGINAAKLATLEAIIKKKHVTHRSEATITQPVELVDLEAGNMIEEIIEKYPQHKRVLLFKAHYSKYKILSVADKEELVKFYKLLISSKK